MKYPKNIEKVIHLEFFEGVLLTINLKVAHITKSDKIMQY